MRHGYKIRTYQRGQRGAFACVFYGNLGEVYRTPTLQGDVSEGYKDGSDRRAAAFAAREWIRGQREAGKTPRDAKQELGYSGYGFPSTAGAF